MKAKTITFAASSSALMVLALSGCELGPKAKNQMAYRGTGMNQVTTIDKNRIATQSIIPANIYETPNDEGPRASETYENVRVLGGVSTERFNHFMAQINNWVVPAKGLPESEQGCNYCHNPANMASDEKYTKVVARRMIQMTQAINVNWSGHVQQTGVTCWTCHRGNAVPAYRWAASVPGGPAGTIVNNKRGQNTPAPSVSYASLPYDPFAQYLNSSNVQRIRVGGGIHPGQSSTSLKDAEKTYGLMMHMSSGLGVNCTYCHNTHNFQAWTNSTKQRVTAWYGLRMVAGTNQEYMDTLAAVFPAVNKVVSYDSARKGPAGDVYKVNCQTCHQGVYKPLYGQSMRADNPVLWPAVAKVPVAASVGALRPDPNATVASCDADFARALQGKTVEFDTGKASIRQTSATLLDGLVSIAGRCSNFKMSVEGHTDARGNAAANMRLSDARAEAVSKYLVDAGIASAQLNATGFGQTRLIDTSSTPEGDQKNRRIEINVAGR
jgi:photosynthetic reaction center cytochrome c subunit